MNVTSLTDVIVISVFVFVNGVFDISCFSEVFVNGVFDISWVL